MVLYVLLGLQSEHPPSSRDVANPVWAGMIPTIYASGWVGMLPAYTYKSKTQVCTKC